MITNLHTILPLLLLTTTTTLIPSATASTTLKNEVSKLPDYTHLTLCQKKCIDGGASNQADQISIFHLTDCETKACFCPPQNEPQIGQQAQKCLEAGSGVCATVKQYNGLMEFVAKYCGFAYVPATTGLLFPPSGGATTTMRTATSTLGSVTTSCWDRNGYPVPTADCSSSMITATRTSDPYLTPTDTASSSGLPTDLPFGSGKGKGKGGLSLERVIGLSVFGFCVSAIMSAFGCYYVCPWFCCCC